jgi:FecR protein
MPDEYLWDRSGDPDPEVARLEALLSPYRYQPKRRRSRLALYALAATILLAAGLASLLIPRNPSIWRIAGKPVPVGQTIETGSESAQIDADEFGQLELDPKSRLQLLPARDGNQQFALRQGTMHALIWAPPSRFIVETPSAKTIDLGCSYTLTVLPDSSGLLTVQTGWVAFQTGTRESFIPSGAACRTLPRRGPGLPYFEDSSPAFQAAISRFDRSERRSELETIVNGARRQDALTLWHLIVRTSGADRDLVAQRFAALVPGSDAAALRAGNGQAIDQAWNLLGLGRTEWWRMWKHGWQL